MAFGRTTNILYLQCVVNYPAVAITGECLHEIELHSCKFCRGGETFQ